MPRSKAGINDGFLNDADVIDAVKIGWCISTFFTILNYLNNYGGNRLDPTKSGMRILMWLMGLPTSGTYGVKKMVENKDIQNALASAQQKVQERQEDMYRKVQEDVKKDPKKWATLPLKPMTPATTFPGALMPGVFAAEEIGKKIEKKPSDEMLRTAMAPITLPKRIWNKLRRK